MMSYIWPIALVVFSNVVYQICAKSVPKHMDVLASMTVTYLVGAVCSAILYGLLNKNGNLIQEYGKLNLAPILLGVSVVGLEVGFIYIRLQGGMACQYRVYCAERLPGAGSAFCGRAALSGGGYRPQSCRRCHLSGGPLFHQQLKPSCRPVPQACFSIGKLV